MIRGNCWSYAVRYAHWPSAHQAADSRVLCETGMLNISLATHNAAWTLGLTVLSTLGTAVDILLVSGLQTVVACTLSVDRWIDFWHQLDVVFAVPRLIISSKKAGKINQAKFVT